MPLSELEQRVVGAFKLESITSERDGHPLIPDKPFGPKPSGTVIYTPSGYMTALLHATEPHLRPKLSPFDPSGPDAQWAVIGKNAMAYSGPFRIKSNGIIEHGPIVASTLPYMEGTTQVREFEFLEDRQVLLLRFKNPEGAIDSLRWRRLKERDA